MTLLTRYDHGIYAFDSGYLRPRCAAIHLIVENGRVAFIETGSRDSLPRAQAALAELGLSAEAVDWVIVTHVHLDHAGGAGAYLQAFANAKLAVHPRGARHMIDPAKLWAGTVGVYGEEKAVAMYSELLPIAAERVVEAGEGTVLDLAGRKLHCIDTPGHATHHLCVVDQRSGAVFTGDTFGLSYREMDKAVAGGFVPVIFPTTTPVQFDPEAMHASFERIAALQPPAVYLTHYSELRNVPQLAADLHRLLDAFVDVARREKDAGEARQARIAAGLHAVMAAEAARLGSPLGEAERHALLDLDMQLNAQGLCVWLDKAA